MAVQVDESLIPFKYLSIAGQVKNQPKERITQNIKLKIKTELNSFQLMQVLIELLMFCAQNRAQKGLLAKMKRNSALIVCEYANIENNIFFGMKKYQLWLQRKSYSQHLFNLMKIKNSHHSSLQKLQHPATPIRSPNKQNSTLTRYKEPEENQISADKLGDISYAITYKELKNRKLRIMKTFEIMNQNMSMARRINGVKSVLNNISKDKTISEHYSNKRKIFEKKCELSNEEIREQNFKKFIRWQNNKTNGLHPYYLTLTVENITKILNCSHQYAAAWCEISTEKGFVRSELVTLEEFQGRKLFFSLQNELPKDCLFRLYICKGLKSEIVGQFQFSRPEVGQTTKDNYRSDDGQFEVTMKVQYSKIRKQRHLFNLK